MYVVSTNIGTLNALCPYPTITFLIQHCFAKIIKKQVTLLVLEYVG